MSSKASAKFVEEIGKLSVFELAELIKEIEQAFGVSAAAPVASAASSAESAAPAAAAKTEFKVILKDFYLLNYKIIILLFFKYLVYSREFTITNLCQYINFYKYLFSKVN